MIDLSEFDDWPADIDVVNVGEWSVDRLLAVAEACQREAVEANPLERVMLGAVLVPVTRRLDDLVSRTIEVGLAEILEVRVVGLDPDEFRSELAALKSLIDGALVEAGELSPERQDAMQERLRRLRELLGRIEEDGDDVIWHA